MLSVVIPIFNESQNIEILAKKIKKSLLSFKYEVIFINDGLNHSALYGIRVQDREICLNQFLPLYVGVNFLKKRKKF